MKSVHIEFNFDDGFYEELSELAQNLNISIPKLISEFFEEGLAFSWNAFQHEARQKYQDNQQRRQNIKLVRKQKKKSE